MTPAVPSISPPPAARPLASSTAGFDRLSPRARILAALAALLLLAWLIVGASLTPDASGMGTHRQLGLPPCGWVLAFGKPCPTCGMTTSFANASHGWLWASLKAQPFATFLAIGAGIGFWACLYSALTGSGVVRVYAFLLRPRWVWAMLGFLVLSWGYKLAVATG